jgi:transcriptional regulator with XRE-family HTH domain
MKFRIRELRDERGWNQTALAYRAGMSVSQISLIESGKRNPSAASLKNLADALEVDIAELFQPEYEAHGHAAEEILTPLALAQR